MQTKIENLTTTLGQVQSAGSIVTNSSADVSGKASSLSTGSSAYVGNRIASVTASISNCQSIEASIESATTAINRKITEYQDLIRATRGSISSLHSQISHLRTQLVAVVE